MKKLSCLSALTPLLALALANVACSDVATGDVAMAGSGGTASVNGTAGTAAASTAGAQAAGGGSAAVSGGGTSASGSGGQYVSVVPLAGSGQAIGGGDQGVFFDPSGSVPIMPADTAGTGSGGGGGGSGIPGDGKMVTSTIKGKVGGTAVFSQKGEDVTVVVSLNNCADGNHQFRIHDGYSCDNDSTEGKPWPLRGVGIGPDSGIACSGNKGSLTYTRSGADKTKNWTVGDHVQATDVSAHVVIVSDEKDPSSRASCGNFF